MSGSGFEKRLCTGIYCFTSPIQWAGAAKYLLNLSSLIKICNVIRGFRNHLGLRVLITFPLIHNLRLNFHQELLAVNIIVPCLGILAKNLILRLSIN